MIGKKVSGEYIIVLVDHVRDYISNQQSPFEESKMRNRQKDEIARDILSVCNGGTTITKVMFHAYLTHAQAKGYLGELIEKGLIETDPFNSKEYRTAPKGMEYLAGLERMTEMLPVETRRSVKSSNNQTALL